MSKSSSRNDPTDYPEYGVNSDTIRGFFDPPLASSTFYDLVNKGKIIRMKGMRGFYLLNESLRRLGLREVPQLPADSAGPSFEDIVRLAFTLIDRAIFPEPSWLLSVEVIDIKDADHARRLADQYRDTVEAFDHVSLKLAYFQGVLDSVFVAERLADS
ncbi:hypothetical protein [Haloferula sp.]|uniref:hypothetical protein n=1 Tax=Haloferula sp. TaxID=2497595 RepID=UPI003C72B68D